MAGHTECLLCGRAFEQRGRGGRRAYCRRCTARADREVGRVLRVDCKECGKKFSTTNRLVRYCSDGCRTEGVRRYNREYQRKSMADPEKRAIIIARTRASAAARAARKRGGRPPQRQALPRMDPDAKPSTCRLCGRAFAQYGRGGHSYCKRCTAKADRAITGTLHIKCKACGKAITTTNRLVRYCSDGCRAEGLRRSRRKSDLKRKADPEKRAIEAAHVRAWHAARRGRAAR